jgi:hypothetical protein
MKRRRETDNSGHHGKNRQRRAGSGMLESPEGLHPRLQVHQQRVAVIAVVRRTRPGSGTDRCQGRKQAEFQGGTNLRVTRAA